MHISGTKSHIILHLPPNEKAYLISPSFPPPTLFDAEPYLQRRLIEGLNHPCYSKQKQTSNDDISAIAMIQNKTIEVPLSDPEIYTRSNTKSNDALNSNATDSNSKIQMYLSEDYRHIKRQ